MARLVGLDLGTSGVRFESYDLEGNTLAAGRSKIGTETVKEWLISIRAAIPKRNRFPHPEEVLLSAHGTSGTALLVDEYGTDLYRPLMYYEKDAEQFRRIENLRSMRSLSKMGNPLSVTSPLPKLLGVAKKYPQMFRRVRWILPATTWLLYRLVIPEGEKWDSISTDWTDALKFGADVTRDPPLWFKSLFDDVELSIDLLPRIVACGEELGEAQSRLAEQIGLRNARVFHGMTDGNAAAIAVGCTEDGDFGFSSGSSTAIKYACSQIKPHRALYYHRHPFRGYLAGAAPVTVSTARWFTEKIMGLGVEKAFELAEKAELPNEYLYFPQGDREPFGDPQLGASFLRIWPEVSSRDAARGMIFRAMILGLTFLENYYKTLLEGMFHREIVEARIMGGGTRSPWWNKLRASIYEIPVRVMDERPGLGALMPAVLKLNLFKNLREAQDALLRARGVYEPDKALGLKYRNARDNFLNRWNMVREASAVM